ncbi:CopG family transcriptional regulator [Curtobacterium sp. MCBD17_040]|uniref:plasmid mobilization protein n=1 Tax=Curtobacterium sp. MCBD17_040 TaxID=2175674 RepID=UPI000DAA7558|nr:CopG family transcriptional regulator [Curtobacterium sp. MCBD17_040]WIB62979.1 CopG family transcriptional regulator [Curtobacterium sp. MCBD17_040]
MKTYKTKGTTFTDADLDRWADEADAGFPNAQFGPSHAGSPARPGRPKTLGDDVTRITVRVNSRERSILKAKADAQHLSTSALLREMINNL